MHTCFRIHIYTHIHIHIHINMAVYSHLYPLSCQFSVLCELPWTRVADMGYAITVAGCFWLPYLVMLPLEIWV